MLNKEAEDRLRKAVSPDSVTPVNSLRHKDVEDLLAELDHTRQMLNEITNGVRDLRVLRVSCEHSESGMFRVHLVEAEWDKLESSCNTFNRISK
jgi:hypothetical protein